MGQVWSSFFVLPCWTQALQPALVHKELEKKVGQSLASVHLPGSCWSAVCGAVAVGCVC